MKASFALIPFLLGLAAAGEVVYTLNLTVGTAAPDGVSRQVYLVNGQTPGPELVATQGDQVSITIINNLEVDATVHFHGVSQQGSIWSDGVPGVTQRMISPGNNFVANFTAIDHGLYWYHAHSRAIYGDGIRGSFNILPSDANLQAGPWSQISNTTSDITAMKTAHMNPQLLSIIDWTHWTSEYGLSEWNRTRTEFLCIDSVLLNGMGRVICPPASTFTPFLSDIVPNVTVKGCAYPNNSFIQPFSDKQPDLVDPSIFFECTNTTTPLNVIAVNQSTGWASFAIVNMGALWDFKVSIDDHTMWVYAADGQFHSPQEVNVIDLPPGERFQVMVKLDKPVGDYAIRASTAITPQFISGYGVLSYQPSPTTGTVIPPANNQSLTYGGTTISGFKELDPLTLVPFPASLTPPQTPNVTLLLNLYRLTSLTWSMNMDPFAPYLELVEPLLLDPAEVHTMDQNIVPSYPVGSIVDAVIITNPGNPKHPIHKHGVKAWIIGYGSGNWTWTSVAEAQQANPQFFNLVNPPLRDGFHTADSVPSGNWLVIRYVVTEPGVVFFHCHINIHTYGGMAVALVEGLPTETLTIPDYYVQWDNAAAAAQGAKKIRKARSEGSGNIAGSQMAAIVRRAE